MSKQVIRDSRSREIGYYKIQPNGEIRVYDNRTTYLGKANHMGTFDANGKRLTTSKEPGLLLSPR